MKSVFCFVKISIQCANLIWSDFESSVCNETQVYTSYTFNHISSIVSYLKHVMQDTF